MLPLLPTYGFYYFQFICGDIKGKEEKKWNGYIVNRGQQNRAGRRLYYFLSWLKGVFLLYTLHTLLGHERETAFKARFFLFLSSL